MLKKLETELKINGASPRTIRNYCYYVGDFSLFTSKAFVEAKEEDVKKYMAFLMYDRTYSAKTVNLVLLNFSTSRSEKSAIENFALNIAIKPMFGSCFLKLS